MRLAMVIGVAALVLAGCASSGAPAVGEGAGPSRSVGTWTFSFDAGPGLASAILGGSDGLVLFEMKCQAPRGPVSIKDWTFARAKQGETSATLKINASATTQAARVLGTGDGRQALAFEAPASDPVWRALTPEAQVSVNSGGREHALASGAASRMNDVLNACLQRGS
jgi:hypothetical protein